jgi:DNA-binding FrmR family transcriptional regulator
MDHSSVESQKALAFLKNARGQADAAIRMMEENRYCIDVSKQILAAAALLKKANLLVLRQHIDTCVKDAIDKDQGKEKIEEIAMILERYMGDPDGR